MKKIIFLLFILHSHVSSAQLNLSLLGEVDYPGQTCAGVWHYVDSLNNEYALVGAANEVSIVDVTNPATAHQVFSVPAPASSLWRELKTYNGYAYVVSEGGGGVIIINLNYLPDSIQTKTYSGDGIISGTLNTAHTVETANGYLYVFGSNIANGGAVIADLTDPWNPVYTGQYNTNYIHDGYVRNDTLWAGEIYDGLVAVINVSDKTNPQQITSFSTPGQFTHNTWLSDNSQYLYTTDELHNKPVGSFDVSDLNNIRLVDTYLTDSMPAQEVHNVRVINDYIIAPSYGSQLTICDAARPNNIVETANYPTGSFLCWDASPYLPSGHIIATDTDGKLYIFQPTYTRACYLEGLVSDSTTGSGLPNSIVRISNGKTSASKIDGTYATGIINPGLFDVTFIKPGYISKTFTGIVFNNGVLNTLNAQLVPFTLNGSVTNAANGDSISGAVISLQNADGTYGFISDPTGQFTISGVPTGTFDLIVSHWGYREYCGTVIIDEISPVVIQLQEGYEDNFESDLGWTITSTATGGIWTRAVPIGTLYGSLVANPDSDATDDCGNYAYVTGNVSGNPNNGDVDNGYTILTSPAFDISNYLDPYINYERWFFIQPGIGIPSYDTLTITLSDGINSPVIDYVTYGSPGSQWITQSIRVNNFMTPAASMQISIKIEDKQFGGNLLEGGFDNFSITEGPLGLVNIHAEDGLVIYPNPFSGECHINIPKNLTGPFTVEIIDVAGRVVATEKLQGTGLLTNVSALTPGIYLVRMQAAGKTLKPLRIIKQ